ATTLARLTHPNIARLLDAGVTDEGQPFLLLEYVEGKRIDVYCDEQRLPPDRRLELFLQVLGAVGHAHANLIVHRDLKPSNILVTGDGSVKLLDFGIAKLLEDETSAGERSALTEVGGLALTPEYAAPEQAAGLPVTTATDVYALGVLLYILLSGRHPTGEGCRSAAEHLRAVTETDPPRLSVAMVQAEGGAARDAAHAAAARGTTVERLRRLYAGDPGNIVAQALKKEPAERYATVEAFATDVRRYLRHEPVSARPDSLGYRLGKFVRRNRTAVGLGAVALAAMLAGLAGTVTQARRAARQAVQARQERDRADQAAQAAQNERDFALQALSRIEAINELNHFLLRDAAPFGKPFTFGDLLARATDLVGRERAESDVNRTDMLIELGQDYYDQDQDTKSRELLEQAYALSRPLADHSTRARAACALGQEMARWDEARAERLVQEGLADLPVGPSFDLDRIACLQAGAEAASNSTEGIQRAEAALTLYRRMRFPPPALEPQLLTTTAYAYDAAGRYRDAVRMEEEASARFIALGRGDTQSMGSLYNNWGLTRSRMGQPVKAEPLFRKALEMESAARGGQAVSPVVVTNLARTLSELGKLEEAARFAERAYASARQAGDSELVNQSMLVRTGIYINQHRLGPAKAMLDEV
ncbi:MAG TPA: serine/threonine-protein kinase, partial [Gemmatimonadales bacterium]